MIVNQDSNKAQIKRTPLFIYQSYFINYVFPQYVLPSNNFFTGVTTSVTRSF